MFGRLTQALQSNGLVVGFTVLVLALTIFYFVCALPVSPEGDYHLHVFGLKSERLVFHDGKVEVQMPGTTPRSVGAYFNVDGQWIFQSSITREQKILAPGFLGIGSIDPKTKVREEYFPRTRVYWLFLGKTWATEAIDQMQQWFSP